MHIYIFFLPSIDSLYYYVRNYFCDIDIIHRVISSLLVKTMSEENCLSDTGTSTLFNLRCIHPVHWLAADKLLMLEKALKRKS